jgi:hypothetical protein
MRAPGVRIGRPRAIVFRLRFREIAGPVIATTCFEEEMRETLLKIIDVELPSEALPPPEA